MRLETQFSEILWEQGLSQPSSTALHEPTETSNRAMGASPEMRLDRADHCLDPSGVLSAPVERVALLSSARSWSSVVSAHSPRSS
jgi:hypothetical protein